MKRKNEPKLPFKIGSDPEFLLFYGDRGLDASEIISSFFQRNTKVRQASSGYRIEGVGDFGWDGASSTGELRPSASDTIQDMVNKLGTMIKTIAEKMPSVDITTLSIGSPIGGHIHVDSFMHNPNEFSRGEAGRSSRNSAEYARVNNTLASFLLPLAASDHRVSALTRMRGNNYGKLTDIRYEVKGPVVTAEIRGLTAEWLTTPEVAYATLAYVVTVWHELSKRSDELAKLDFVTRTSEQNQTIHKMVLSDFKMIEQTLCRAIRKEIKTFELYPKYKDQIEFILRPTLVMKAKAAVGWNINRGWNLAKLKKGPTKKDLMHPTIATTILKKQNIPDVHQHFGINYNDDYNVAMFSSAIAERIAALSWGLKNQYFLFGLKKGVEGFVAVAPDGKYYKAPTNRPHAETSTTLLKMSQKARNNVFNGAKLDPKTGRIRKFGSKSEQIIIGIPYEDRSNKDIKNLIELIWKIENNKLESQTFNATNFPVQMAVVNKNAEPTLVDLVDNMRDVDPYNYDVSSTLGELNQS